MPSQRPIPLPRSSHPPIPIDEPEPSFTQPKEGAFESEYQGVGPDPIITEPAIELVIITPEGVANKAVATATTELPFRTVLDDATSTVSSSGSESEIEDAVDVTVSSDSEVEVTLEAEDATFDAEKDLEMLNLPMVSRLVVVVPFSDSYWRCFT